MRIGDHSIRSVIDTVVVMMLVMIGVNNRRAYNECWVDAKLQLVHNKPLMDSDVTPLAWGSR